MVKLCRIQGRELTPYTRNDNDQYSHLNNSVYNLLFDTIINKYLIEKCNLRPSDTSLSSQGHPIALVVESHADFFRPLSFPSRIILGMRVLRLGKSSVTYQVGVFGPLKDVSSSRNQRDLVSQDGDLSASLAGLLEDQRPAVVGGFTHVFVERDTRRPVKAMPSAILDGLLAVSAKPVSTRL